MFNAIIIFLQMLFNKNSLKFEMSIQFDKRFKRYELFIMSGYGFYHFKNGNQVNNFATSYTNLIDEVIFNCDLLLFKLNSFSSFLSPAVINKNSKENVFYDGLREASHYLNSLKLAKVYPCEFHRINFFVLKSIDCVINMCINIDKRLVNDVNQIYLSATDLRSKFQIILKYYQNGLTDKDLTLYSSSTLLSLIPSNPN